MFGWLTKFFKPHAPAMTWRFDLNRSTAKILSQRAARGDFDISRAKVYIEDLGKFLGDDTASGVACMIYCPGCGHAHTFEVRYDGREPNWLFNGDLKNPTFSPSLKYARCHFFVENGKINYMPDSKHQFSGQIIDLPEHDWT